jgi:hypothetical protein
MAKNARAAAGNVVTGSAPANSSCLHQIGETAGAIWKTLDKHGAMSLAKLVEHVGGNRDVVMQAIGWLAREDKLEISETSRGRTIALKAETTAS